MKKKSPKIRMTIDYITYMLNQTEDESLIYLIFSILEKSSRIKK